MRGASGGTPSNNNDARPPVRRQPNPVDQRPFQSRVELERERSLELQYRSLAIPEVVAALRHMSAPRGAEPARERLASEAPGS